MKATYSVSGNFVEAQGTFHTAEALYFAHALFNAAHDLIRRTYAPYYRKPNSKLFNGVFEIRGAVSQNGGYFVKMNGTFTPDEMLEHGRRLLDIAVEGTKNPWV